MINCKESIIEKALEITKNYSVVMMCSMGVDSVAATHYLLHSYDKIFKSTKLDIYSGFGVFHFNHKLRPQNDLMEEKFYEFLDKEFHKNWYLEYVGTPLGFKKGVVLHTEADCRKERLNEFSLKFHRNVGITAHHLDDCVESYLLNCFRGHEGYQPIPFLSEFNQNNTTNVICHPFIFTKKQDFIDYAIKHDLMKYVVEDETNKVTKGSRRNMIRNDIIPILKRDKVGLETIVKKKMEQRLMLELLK